MKNNGLRLVNKSNEPLTWVLLQVWQGVVVIGFSWLSAGVSADGILLGF
jgi:hypothetical protein